MVRQRDSRLGRLRFTGAAVLVVAGCGGPRPIDRAPAPLTETRPVSESAIAEAILSAMRAHSGAQLPAGRAESFEPVAGGLRARFGAKMTSARVRFPDLSLEPVSLEDAGSGTSIDIALQNALIVEAEAADGFVVYPKAHASGATLLHHALPDGLEDYLGFETAPKTPEISYKLSLVSGVAGLRLISGALEMLDATGTPRLRVSPPYIVGADGTQTNALLAVEGCRYDSSGAPPWGRKVTPPGAKTCTVRVSWNNDDVAYPAVLDPRWTTTGTSMVASRTDHTATLLSDGRVLVTGGRTSNTSTTGLNTAEVFNPAGGGTWAGTNSMTGARYMHTATLLTSSANTSTSGRVLIAGGVTGTASVNTTQLWNPANGQWANGPNLNAARHGHTATLMVSSGANNGNVLVTGGMSLANNTTTVLNTAAIYTNPTSGTSTGSWAATGNMGTARRLHSATMLTTNSPNNTNFVNMVLVAGGNTVGTTSTTSAQLFNPTNSTWTNTTALGTAREGHTATRLANGNVLMTGGRTNNGSPINTTAVFTIPASGTAATWPASGNMQAARIAHSATLLGTTLATTGSVLVVGGSTNGTAALSTAELWNGSAFSLIPTSLPSAVQAHTATLLMNGTVLVAGGNSGTNAVNTARIFDPSLGGTCTTNGQCLSTFCVIPSGQSSGVCCDTACTNQCQACNLTGSVGTCSTRPANSTCSDNNACTNNDTCQGTTCGGSTINCPGADQCHTVSACSPTSGCPQPQQLSDGTACNNNNASTEIDACFGGSCIGTANPANVTSFDVLGRWSVGAGGAGTIVGLNSNHTQGTKALEVTAQNYVPFDSVQMGSLGTVGPLVLLDILLPTQQPNPSWFGSVQIFVNAPSVGINNAFLGQAELTGLPLATWQTLAFQLTADQVTRLSGSYRDLTFRIALNVPFNETGHYLVDNLRFSADIFLVLQGIAKDSADVTKAIFTYTTTAASVSIPYGAANSLSDQVGFIHAPLELPPQTFVAVPHPAFVATLAGTQLTWKVGSHSVTATPTSTQLPTEIGTGGGKSAILPDGTRVPLDTPVSPALATAIVPSDTSFTPTDAATDVDLVSSGQPPIGPTSAGKLDGSFQVTNDGAGEYKMPLEVPHGRNGVEPRLSLSYSSRSGEGFLGPGWALKGIGRITRCRIPYSVASERGRDPSAITYTDADDFCLDGERMVSVGPEEYRLKRDSFSRVKVTARDSRGPLTFEIRRKNGLIESYGLNQVSRSELTRVTPDANGQVPPGSGTRVRVAWGLEVMADRFGNTMEVRYASNSQFVPQALRYTSNARTGRSATKTVTLSYSNVSRPLQFQGGVPLFDDLLLNNITISAPNPVTPSVVTTYKFTYTTPSITGRRLLTRVQRCDGAGVCMAPTVFTWEAGSYGFRHADTNVNDFFCASCDYGNAEQRQVGSRFMLSADVNGDGFDDLVYRSALEPFDESSIASTTVRYRLGTPFGFGQVNETGLPLLSADHINRFIYDKPEAIDIDGDGRTDFAYAMSENQNIRNLYRSTGAGTLVRLPPGLTNAQLEDPNLNQEAVRAQSGSLKISADLNGDGLNELGRVLSVDSICHATLPRGRSSVFG